MRAIVAIAILLLVLLLGGLILYILLRRTANVLLSNYRRRRGDRLERAVEAWLASDPESLPRELRHPRPWLDRSLLVGILFARLPAAVPASRARMIAWLESRGFVAAWINDLSARSTWKRANAAEHLATLRVDSSVEPLVRALEDPVFDVRMRVARALGALGGRKARQALVGALGDENRWSVIRIADLLAEMGPEVVDELVEAFPRMSRASRIAAIDLIAHVGDRSSSPFLSRQLDDLDRDIRARAASALGRIGDTTAVSRLLPALQDAEWPVRAMAAKALGELGGLEACDGLAASLRDREWWVRANAAEALKRLGAPGLERLVAVLDDQDRFARDQALSILESSGELARRLAPLGQDDGQAHDEAARLLEVLVSHQSRGRMETLLARQTDERVRAAIDAALAAGSHPSRSQS